MLPFLDVPREVEAQLRYMGRDIRCIWDSQPMVERGGAYREEIQCMKIMCGICRHVLTFVIATMNA